MHKKNKFKVIVAIAVALAFMLPTSAVFANIGTFESEQNSMFVPLDNNLNDTDADKIDNRYTRGGLPGDTVYDEYNDIMYVEPDISVDDTSEGEMVGIGWDNTPTESLPRRIIYVDDDNTEGPWGGTPEHPYQYIQDGIDNAMAGDIIYVLNGIYYENVVVNKQITLIGENRKNTIIDAGGGKDEYVAAVDVVVSDVTISDFTMTNGTWGIHMRSVSNNSIVNCDCHSNSYWGIQLLNVSGGHSSNHKIINCTIYNNSQGGLQLYYPCNCEIRDCTFYGNYYYSVGSHFNLNNRFINCTTYNNDKVGFDLQDSSYNTFINCTSYKNSADSAGFLVRAIFYSAVDNEIVRCDVHGNPYGMYASSSKRLKIINCSVYDNIYGIDIYRGLDTKITECNVYNNSIYGIYLRATRRYTKVTNCDVYNNKCGAYIYDDYSGNEIADSNFYNNQQGIYLERSSNCNIMNCNAYNNSGSAIGLSSSPDNSIANCEIHDNPDNAIYFDYSSNCNLRGNTIYSNAYNFHISGGAVNDFYQDIDASNTINGKHIYYLVGESGLTLDESNDIGYIGLVSCTNVTVKNLDTFGVMMVDTTDSTILNVTSHDSIYGICPAYSSSIDIINCNAYNNRYGIRLYFASNITITNCTLSSNSRYGIYLWESLNNSITYCSSYNNHHNGIRLGCNSSSNLVYYNNFVNNVENAYDQEINTWDDGSRGNYWSDYTGVDEDGDGIGDTPYNIPHGSNQDRYPLMNPLDEIPPVITDVKATPELQGTIDPVNITCKVIDNVEVDTVKVHVDGPEGFTLEEEMNEGSYWYEDVYTILGVYEYFIWANDTSGNIAVSDIYSFIIHDGNLPISCVDPLPSWTKTVPFTVIATAFDDTGVENVTLWSRYSTDGTDWTDWASYGTDTEETWSWEFMGSDGYYEFYSIAVDEYGNVEDPPDIADATTGIDTTKPVTIIILDGNMGDNDWYVDSVTVTLSASDILSGVESTWYRLDSGYWKFYTAPFTVSSEGQHTVEAYSFDSAGNKEDTKSVEIKIDKTPPLTEHEFDGIIGKEGWFVGNVGVTLIATDTMSGVNYTMYKLNDGEWITYADPFVVTEDGDHTLYYYSVDLAGNIEPTNEAAFKIFHDIVPPVTTHEFDGIMGDNNWYTSNVVVTLSAEDDSAGVDYTMYKLDDDVEWQNYIGSFYVTEDAEHSLYYYSVDRVGNKEEVNEVALKIDKTSPTADLAVENIGGKTWLLTATVSDETSGIAKVEFYVDDGYIGEVTDEPYEFEYTGSGSVARAIAYDNAGNEALSPPRDPVPQSQPQQSSSSTSTPISRLLGLW